MKKYIYLDEKAEIITIVKVSAGNNPKSTEEVISLKSRYLTKKEIINKYN